MGCQKVQDVRWLTFKKRGVGEGRSAEGRQEGRGRRKEKEVSI